MHIITRHLLLECSTLIHFTFICLKIAKTTHEPPVTFDLCAAKLLIAEGKNVL